MSDYVGTVIIDEIFGKGKIPSSILLAPQTYRSFFGDEECTRVISMNSIWINYKDLFFRYIGSENDISFWKCQESEDCICVDENSKIYVIQPKSILDEREIVDLPEDDYGLSPVIEEPSIDNA
jgi:hypothetical protein